MDISMPIETNRQLNVKRPTEFSSFNFRRSTTNPYTSSDLNSTISTGNSTVIPKQGVVGVGFVRYTSQPRIRDNVPRCTSDPFCIRYTASQFDFFKYLNSTIPWTRTAPRMAFYAPLSLQFV